MAHPVGTDALVVLTTANSAEQAERIASSLVEERLAACVNILGPMTSVYRWEGAVTRDEERLLVIKTSSPLFESVRGRIKALHSYTVPEVIAVEVERIDETYLEWLLGSVAPGAC